MTQGRSKDQVFTNKAKRSSKPQRCVPKVEPKTHLSIQICLIVKKELAQSSRILRNYRKK